jgi:glycosyltransferase involved in cell wall biosynthesis
MHDTGERVPDRPCKGNYVICGNVECPIYGVEKMQSSCNCKPSKCKFFSVETVPCSIILPARNEEDIYNTIENYLHAGAAEIIVIDDCSDTQIAYNNDRVHVIRHTDPKGPSYCRNLGAREATKNVIIYSDAHVRFDGDLKEFAAKAASDRHILCATCRSLESGGISGYGAHWSYDRKWGCYRVVWNRQRPEERYSEVQCLCGSVYAMTKDAYAAFGGWPATISHGYNEGAISMAATFAAVPMIVDRDTSIRHQFRPAAPYQIRGRDQAINRVIAHYIMFEDFSEWQDRFAIVNTYGIRHIKRNRAELDRERESFAKLRKRSDADVLAIMGEGKEMIVAGIMAIAPEFFPLWKRCLASLAQRCDKLYVRVDLNHLGGVTLDEIRSAAGERLCGIMASTEGWNRWNWREDLLRMLDRADCDIVLCPDQDEEFGEEFDADLKAFYVSGKDGMMIDFVCPTDDGSAVEKYPGKPHMKAFRWRKGLTYRNYQGFARLTDYASAAHHWQAASKLTHLCFLTPEMRSAKVLH